MFGRLLQRPGVRHVHVPKRVRHRLVPPFWGYANNTDGAIIDHEMFHMIFGQATHEAW
jgi:hypothetical protein